MKIKCAICKREVEKRADAKYCSQKCKLVGWALNSKNNLRSKKIGVK